MLDVPVRMLRGALSGRVVGGLVLGSSSKGHGVGIVVALIERPRELVALEKEDRAPASWAYSVVTQSKHRNQYQEGHEHAGGIGFPAFASNTKLPPSHLSTYVLSEQATDPSHHFLKAIVQKQYKQILPTHPFADSDS